MLLLITLIALACLCDSHRRLQCTRCVCVLCMQECVSVSCIRALDVTVCLCMWSSSSRNSSSRISISILQFWQLPGGTVSPTVCHPFPSLPDCLSRCPSRTVCLSVGRAVSHIMAGRQAAFPISHSEAQTNAKAFLSLLPLINSLANRFAQLFPSPFLFPY